MYKHKYNRDKFHIRKTNRNFKPDRKNLKSYFKFELFFTVNNLNYKNKKYKNFFMKQKRFSQKSKMGKYFHFSV